MGAKCVRQPEDDQPSKEMVEDTHTDEEAPGSPQTGNTLNIVLNKSASHNVTNTQLILQKMAEFKADITRQRLADKAEMKAEIRALTAKMEALFYFPRTRSRNSLKPRERQRLDDHHRHSPGQQDKRHRCSAPGSRQTPYRTWRTLLQG